METIEENRLAPMHRSRDESCDRNTGSSCACMYATKEAVIAKEHEQGWKPISII